MIKYAVFPGKIYSACDFDDPYISASRLIRLYKVNPKECLTVDSSLYQFSVAYKEQVDQYIALYPRFDGNYTLPEKP